MTRIFLLAWCVLASLVLQGNSIAFESKPLAADKPLELLRITPSGRDVAQTQEIVFQFNQAVVPLGAMERPAEQIPITISPKLNCEWRWLNTSALACRLNSENAMALATRYRILVNPDIKTESGKTLAKAVKHEFFTQRPQIQYVEFNSWRAPSMPELKVYFNQMVSLGSVNKHLYFQKSNGQRVPVIATLSKTETTEYSEENEASENDQTHSNNKAPIPENNTARRMWIITPAQLMPLDSAVTLQIEPGLISSQGPERGIEKRTVLSFHTFPQFRFLGLRCESLAGETLLLTPEDKLGVNRCDPMQTVALRFSSPVLPSTVRDNLVLTPDLAGGRTDYKPWERIEDYSRLTARHEKDNTYDVWLPELLKAYQNYQLQASNLNFRDEFGRPLVSPIRMAFATDNRAPAYTFEHHFSVLETGIDSEVPIYMTNLDKVDIKFNRFLAQKGWSPLLSHSLAVPKVKNVSIKTPLNIRQLLGDTDKSGLIVGEFNTTPALDANYPKSRWFFSQITPLYVQAKIGHYNSLIWVMDLATGQPVADAKVELFKQDYNTLVSQTAPVLHTAQTDANGLAQLPGTVEFDPDLAVSNSYGDEAQQFFIRVTQDQVVALLPLDYSFSVQMYDLGVSYELYPYSRKKFGHISAWGTTAQGIYKVGDRIQYKIFVRNHDNQRLISAPKGEYTLTVVDPMGNTTFEKKGLKLSEFGGFDGEVDIPKNAPVGWYQFNLKGSFSNLEWTPMQVLVSDFTPSPFRVRTQINAPVAQQGHELQVETKAELHAGGPYTAGKTRLTATLSQESFFSKHPQAKGFDFDTYVENVYDDTVFQTENKLDDHGLLHNKWTLGESAVLYGTLRVESAVQDERGKYIAHTASVPYVGRDRFVGLKQTQWVVEARKPAEILALVVDSTGEPVTGTTIKIQVERRETKAARVKGAGNAYLTQFQHEWVAVSDCELQSTDAPLSCVYNPPQAGTYRLTATIQDSQQRSHQTESYQWVAGSDAVVWESNEGNGLEIVPEQDRYKVGETARYLVKNPYPGAQALITVERFGVLNQWLQPLEHSIELIDIPVLADYEPGFFVSVTVMSPRQAQPLSADGIDLGKPAFRMGYVRTQVTEPYKQLTVDIRSDKAVYRPKDTVTLDLAVKPKTDLALNEPVELTLVVLDEAVFDLLKQGRRYFDPYEGFYNVDDLEMSNYSLLLRLVGRQKFEKKGASAGGDGGLTPEMRTLFKFVSYWNASLRTDEHGKATVSFPVPDNLTGWRVLAIAMTPTDRMGLSDSSFKVNLPIELRPVMPNQVTQGDEFRAGVSVMNRTEQVQTITVQLAATGDSVKHGDGQQTEIKEIIQAKPYQRYTVWLPVQTQSSGDIRLIASAHSESLRDELTHILPVRPQRVLQTSAQYATTTENQVLESIAIPENAQANMGQLSVAVTPTVIGGISGTFRYMRDYPYQCWEQRLSKGVMAANYESLMPYLGTELVWNDSAILPVTLLKEAVDFQAPNGGMAYYLATNERVSPYLSAYTALAFQWLKKQGHQIPAPVENRLHDYLSQLLRRDVLPDFYTKGMSASVRAVALLALAMRQKITRADLKRYEPHVASMDLFGKAIMLHAATLLPNTESLREEWVKDLLGYVTQSAGKVAFNESLPSDYKHILSSPLRTQCAMLSALIAYDEQAQDGLVSDLPFKLVRTISAARQGGGYWSNTQENLFCMNALIDYSRVYEAAEPAMTVTVRLDDHALPTTTGQTQVEFKQLNDAAQQFVYPLAEDAGRAAQLAIQREGDGRLYYNVRLSYAQTVDTAEAVNAGIEIRREYHVERDGKWQLLADPLALQTGDRVRVDLYLSLPTARYFVVVDDPVPGGLEPVNRDLATASQVDAAQAENRPASVYAQSSYWHTRQDWQRDGFWNFYHQELRHHAAIFYSEFLAAGHYHISYVAQAIAPGTFVAMPTKAEEMYEPDIYGLSQPVRLQIERAGN